MGKPAAEFLLPVLPACSGDIQLFFHFCVSSHTLLNVSHLNHLSKISTGITQKGDSGLHCEERQLLITNTQSRTSRQHHHSYKSRAAAQFCRISQEPWKLWVLPVTFFFWKYWVNFDNVFCKGEKMYLKVQILGQQPHGNTSTTLNMSRAQSYHVHGCKLLGAFGSAVLCALGCSCAGAKQAGVEALWPLLG